MSMLAGQLQHKQCSETQAVVRNDCTATIKQKHSLFQSYSQSVLSLSKLLERVAGMIEL